MNVRVVVAIGCLLTALSVASASAQNDSVKAGDWSLSFGLDPRRLDFSAGEGWGVDMRLVANLTRSWQAPDSRIARHMSLFVGSDFPYGTIPGSSPGCETCNYAITSRYAALTAGASYDVFRASRFTPYLTAGTGVYYTKMSRNLGELEARYVDPRYYRTGFSLGANAGVGLKARFGSREVFVEQILHATDLARISKGVWPLNFGIRF
jgi:hypothetical protein